MTSEEKKDVRDQLISMLAAIWESRGVKILDKKYLERKYDKLIGNSNKNYLFQPTKKTRWGWVVTKNLHISSL